MQINFEDAHLVGYEGVRVYDLIEGRKRELWIKTKGKKEVYDIIFWGIFIHKQIKLPCHKQNS
jgi:hypothetical protein